MLLIFIIHIVVVHSCSSAVKYAVAWIYHRIFILLDIYFFPVFHSYKQCCCENSSTCVLVHMCRSFSLFLKINLFLLYLTALGLRCCVWAFSSCGEWRLLFVVVHGLLIAVASRCGAQALGARASVVVAHGLSSCGTRA